MLLVIVVLLLTTQAQNIVFHNDHIRLEFDPISFQLITLTENTTTPNLIATPLPSLWTLQLLVEGSTDPLIVNATSSVITKEFARNSHTQMTFSYYLSNPQSVLVSFIVRLPKSSSAVEFSLSVDANGSPVKFGLWLWEMKLGSQKVSPNHSLIENTGFGLLHNCETCASFSGAYPQRTFQFIGSYSNKTNGIYFATHDPNAESKNFGVDVTSDNLATFWVSAQPPNAGKTLSSYVIAYPIVLSLFDGDWWDAAQIYRSWVLPNAKWTQKGPMVNRTDTPAWVFGLTTWVNSHWQELDIFNISGGDPAVVENRVTNIYKRFNLNGGLGLHWYEWDTLGYKYGSNYTECLSEVTCGFDTHYPEYFPAREGFEKALKNLQNLGVRVSPYINGRIFDQGTEKWKKDNAIQYMSKKATAVLNSADLSIYDEEYGSLAKFAVSCPHTHYWQDIISDTVGELVKKFGTDGVYIDQIAAAGPKNCWDPNHGHAVGGGDLWVAGYRAMLDSVRSLAGNRALILTESNAEPFLDGVNMFLTLVGFGNQFQGPTHIIPIFPAIYGGYYLSMGSVFFASDFANPDLFAAKVAKQYMFGAQLGWFSLGGRDNQKPYMGLYELLMDPIYDPEIAYIRLLSNAKVKSNFWLQGGQAMRDLSLKFNGQKVQDLEILGLSKPPKQNLYHQDSGIYEVAGWPPVMSSVWFEPTTSSLLVTISTVTRKTSGTIEFTLDTSKYGFPLSSKTQNFTLTEIFPGSKTIGTFIGCCIQFTTQMNPRSVISISITKTK